MLDRHTLRMLVTIPAANKVDLRPQRGESYLQYDSLGSRRKGDRHIGNMTGRFVAANESDLTLETASRAYSYAVSEAYARSLPTLQADGALATEACRLAVGGLRCGFKHTQRADRALAMEAC